jgi:hypothetical protein
MRTDPATRELQRRLSALLQYATMKSVPGLVTIISLPSNLISMSMMKPHHTKKPRRSGCPDPSFARSHARLCAAGSPRSRHKLLVCITTPSRLSPLPIPVEKAVWSKTKNLPGAGWKVEFSSPHLRPA